MTNLLPPPKPKKSEDLLEQKQIDPTFIASVFTSTLVSFGVDTGKKKKEDKEEKNDLTKKEK